MTIDYEADYLEAMGLSAPENKEPVVPEKEEKIDYEADYLEAQEQVAVSLANNAPEEAPTAFDRIFTEPFGRAVDRQVAIGGRIAEGVPEVFGGTKPNTIQPLVTKEGTPRNFDYSKGTDIPSVLLQTVGNPVALGFDVAANAITVGAEKAFALLPESAQEGAYEFLQYSLQTETGQKAMAALSSGAEAWDEFSETYPNEAASYSSFFEIAAGLPRTLSGPFVPSRLPDYSPDLKPGKISEIGGRKVAEPLAGIDKDVYNIAFSNAQKTPKQALLTTDPQGPMRTQRQLATKEQLEIVDELKRAGVSGNKTLQQNLNATTAYLDSLEKPLMALAKKVKDPIDPEALNKNLQRVFKKMREDYPSVFNDKAASKKFSKYYQQMLTEIRKQGNTAEGLINARRIFDDTMKREGVDVGSASLNSSVLSAKAMRIAVNDTLFEVLPKAKEIFRRQSKILSVQDNIAIKAAEESKSMLGRYVQELGLDKLVAHTGFSMILNLPIATLGGVLASPFVIMKNLLKTAKPAKIRAQVAYVLRDVFKEIDKGLGRMKDPARKKLLMDKKPVVYAALKSAGDQLIAQSEEEELKKATTVP
jgi:hypothetical protein